MNKLKIITIGTIVVYIAILMVWQLSNPTDGFTTFEPGADNRPAGTARKPDEVVIGEYFMDYQQESPADLQGEWPNFRGVNHDNISSSALQLSKDDFKEMWSVETGEGHGAAAISKGRVYLLDYDEKLSSDALRCFNLQTGKELWRRWYRVPMKRNHGFSRTIPAVFDDKVVTIGPEGHVMCCNAVTGELAWTMDTKKRFGTEIPFWYTGQCPCIDKGTLVLATAGTDTLMVGLDVRTGDLQWATPNTPGLKMSHSSVIPMTLHGKRMYVYAGVGGVCGVSAEDADCGTLLWSQSAWQPSVLAPSPLQLSDSQIFLVAGYGAGGALLQVNRNGNSWSAEVKDSYKADKGMSSEQQTPIYYNGLCYTILPKDGGGMRERIAVYKPSNLHTPVWTSAADERFGLGPYMIIDGRFFAFKEDGELYVYQTGNGSMQLLRKQRVMEEGVDGWGPLAYADGYLIVRDAKNVVCLKIDAEE